MTNALVTRVIWMDMFIDWLNVLYRLDCYNCTDKDRLNGHDRVDCYEYPDWDSLPLTVWGCLWLLVESAICCFPVSNHSWKSKFIISFPRFQFEPLLPYSSCFLKGPLPPYLHLCHMTFQPIPFPPYFPLPHNNQVLFRRTNQPQAPELSQPPTLQLTSPSLTPPPPSLPPHATAPNQFHTGPRPAPTMTRASSRTWTLLKFCFAAHSSRSLRLTGMWPS